MSIQCEVCGNHYDQGLAITVDNEAHQFDCFECAIHGLAPKCDHCGCRIIGHGIAAVDRMYCCQHCAREASGTPSERRA